MEVDGTVEFASAEQDVLLGKTVGSKYLIERYLGGGSMGAVYRAKQTALGKSVAIKVLRRGLARDPSFVARFHREARTAACFDHPNSIRVLDHGEDPDGLLYIIMELLEGESLHRILSQEGPLPLDRIVTLLSQVLGALAAAHDAGILHRDLKPENIIVAEGKDDEGLPADHVKVFDFGIAKLLGDRPEGISSWPGEHPTQAGLIVGTPEYMSPEQGQGLTLDARSDIYSVGVILFQMLTGHVPFEGSSPLGTLMLHLTEEPRLPSSVFPHGCPRLDEICIKALRKNRDERYQTAREMRVDLRNIIGLSAPMSMPGSVHRFGTLHGIGRVVPSSVPLEEASSSPFLGALAPALDSSEETASPSAPVRPVSLVDDEVETRDALSLVAGSVLPPPKRRGFGWLVAASLFAGAAAGALWFVRTQDATTHEAKAEAATAPVHEVRQWSPREDEQGRGIVQVQRGLGTGDGQGVLALAPSAEVPLALPEVVPPAKQETPKNRGRATAFAVPRRSPKGAVAAAKGDTTLPESEVATAAPPSEPALPPMSKDAALRLAFGRMTSSGLEEASVRKLVQGAHGRAARCLREALEAEAPIPPGHGTLTIGSDVQGLVSTVSLSGLELPSITVLCITDAFHGVRVAEPGAAAGSADIGVDVIVP